MRRPFFSAHFVVAAVVLLAAAVGLRPAIAALTEYFSKSPIELRKKFDAFDVDALPSWRLATDRINLVIAEGDVETEDTISLVFEPNRTDTNVFEQTLMFLTYYSDPRDRIAHTPEVCYRQSGAVVESITTIPLDVPGLPGHEEIQCRLLDIDQFGNRTVLLYVFVCNGEFYFDREAVRFAIGWPGDSHIYFSKIETVTSCRTANDYDDAVSRVKSLMREALPLLYNEHLPANEDVR